MNSSQTATDWWSILIGPTAAMLAVWVVSRLSGGAMPFLSAKSFPELSGHVKYEQERAPRSQAFPLETL
jgi:hypothetical protein